MEWSHLCGASSSQRAAWWIKQVLANSFIFPIPGSLSPTQRSQSSFSLEDLQQINNQSLILKRWNAESCLPLLRTCVLLSLIISHSLPKTLSSLSQEYSWWGLEKKKFWWTVWHGDNSSGQTPWKLMLSYLIRMGFYLAQTTSSKLEIAVRAVQSMCSSMSKEKLPGNVEHIFKHLNQCLLSIWNEVKIH